jgi:hypothetical protein
MHASHMTKYTFRMLGASSHKSLFIGFSEKTNKKGHFLSRLHASRPYLASTDLQ